MIPLEDSGPDQTVHLCSLIFTFAVCTCFEVTLFLLDTAYFEHFCVLVPKHTAYYRYSLELPCKLKYNKKIKVKIAITKTCLYNFDILKPHFYIVKLGFTGVYIIFHISAQNIDCGYLLELPRWGGSNEYPQSMFWAEIWKISEFLSENFQFFLW